jgi:hypothetical protein
MTELPAPWTIDPTHVRDHGTDVLPSIVPLLTMALFASVVELVPSPQTYEPSSVITPLLTILSPETGSVPPDHRAGVLARPVPVNVLVAMRQDINSVSVTDISTPSEYAKSFLVVIAPFM